MGEKLFTRSTTPWPWPNFCDTIIDVLLLLLRGVVVPERGGAPFRQIFLSRNVAPANIVYHRRNADTAAFRQISSGRGPVYYDLPKC